MRRFVEFSADELLKGFDQSAIYNVTNPFSWMESKAAAAPKALASTSSASPKTVEVCPPFRIWHSTIRGVAQQTWVLCGCVFDPVGICFCVYAVTRARHQIPSLLPDLRLVQVVVSDCLVGCVQATTDTTKLSFGLDDDDF